MIVQHGWFGVVEEFEHVPAVVTMCVLLLIDDTPPHDWFTLV